MGFSCLFITHDLSVVRFISDRITVMYFGKIMESASCEDMFSDPEHPYSQALLSAAPPADPSQARNRQERVILEGELPSAAEEVVGCLFNTRCPLVVDRCLTERPMLAGITTADHLCAVIW